MRGRVGPLSQHLVQAYSAEIDRIRRVTGSVTEQVLRKAFRRLIDDWSRSLNLLFVEEYEYRTSQKTTVYPDGTVLYDTVRLALGHWEAKDTKDDLDEEIAKKFRKGYPQDNIIFENTETAVLIQNRQEVMRCRMRDEGELQRLLSLFFSYERPEIEEFNKAVAQFRADLPVVLEALRERIDAAQAGNAAFRAAAARFLEHAKSTINPSISEADVREMLIQHILTEEIFGHVFGDIDFHRQNNVARALYALEGTFFVGAVKREALKAMERYYAAIRSAAAQVPSHSEKQKFLKQIYENFYKVYNPKAADRLGVVYTPNEIVRFMIDGADHLCRKHFGRGLIDPDVEILDPATGTGTFVCELLEHMRGDPIRLAHKYKEEIHANEVAILPYYVANLNIEATYYAITGQYAEFPNLCFVDTLDNIKGLGVRSGFQHDLFGALSEENVERIRRQNRRKISVVIGNPPYNANQQNENDANPNRAYPHIDARIKETYIRASTAQKTKLYDMYARFFRWACDRLHDDGVLAFVSNRSFVDARTFDGFRKIVAEEFNEIYVVDLKGDARTSGERRRQEGGNVFDDQIRVGVAVSFFVKRKGKSGCQVYYDVVHDYARGEDKRAWLAETRLAERRMKLLRPDKDGTWIGQAENDWSGMIPVADKTVKAGKKTGQDKAVFKFFTSAIKSNRDDWVYEFDANVLQKKAEYFLSIFSDSENSILNYSIKWSRDLKRKIGRQVGPMQISKSMWRPFVVKYYVLNKTMSDIFFSFHELAFIKNGMSLMIAISGTSAAKPFQAMSLNGPADYEILEKTNLLPLHRYTASGERVDNITDWALRQFIAAYGRDGRGTPPEGAMTRAGTAPAAEEAAGDGALGKDAIFAYVYAVLHDPVYRETYALNLRREFPRIPFHRDFWRWVRWGRRLLDLHVGYETVEPWPVQRIDTPDEKARAAGLAPKPILKADRDAGLIVLDSETRLTGIPPAAHDYRLGNRSALDWVLDQHKERRPKDPTVRERFDTYRFADHKERVADLLARVTRVSVETVGIVEAIRGARR